LPFSGSHTAGIWSAPVRRLWSSRMRWRGSGGRLGKKIAHPVLSTKTHKMRYYPKGKRYFSTKLELLQFRLELKLLQCPHCGSVGCLISHGFLWGYADDSSNVVVRGRRFYCSNRFRKRGCGRTFSVFFADILIGFVVRTETIWRFLLALLNRHSRKAAWEHAAPGFSLTSGYRLWKAFAASQFRIRTLCLGKRGPPQTTACEPLLQLIEHLRALFPTDDALAEFQWHFQTPLFGM